ncbi:Protein N-lysine methyltransferase METTL21A [Linum perenne]
MIKEGEDKEEDEIICLDESFFINDDYQLTTFTFGSHSLQLLCLQSASRQLVWPGATLLNNYLSQNAELLRGCSVLELGSGIGVTGILCSRFCRRAVLTDHNDEILKKNIDIQSSSENPDCCAELLAEKLEWGNSDQHSRFQQSSISLLFETVEQLLRFQSGKCRFILGYVSRVKIMDSLVLKEATQRGLKVHEVAGTRSIISNHEGMIFDISLV